ncbi:AraC family transcriptional regulator [Microbulbifer hainanensis]|uniref:AraC family transcriptional regulator n=1 Tax=Microbulbifer hainanensis TaxID=2735675 RepID=UPI0018689E31|nr:AraC family transcriptional regulator [Microbulbifer hainanensis]
MDKLSSLVSLIAPRGTVDLHCRFSGKWESDHAQVPEGVIPYHVILDGQARLFTTDAQWHLSAGDVVLMPAGSPHRLKSLIESGVEAPLSSRDNGAVTEMVRAGQGVELAMLCGEFRVGAPGALLLEGTPELLRVRTGERADCVELRELMTMLGRESISGQPGSLAIVRELSTTLFTLLLRALVTENEPAPGLLSLMADAKLAPAIAAVLAEPQTNWTNEAMATLCHVSRATFARHFRELYHLAPLEWVTQVRMVLAARLLREKTYGIARIAEECGYQSQAAFSRAFKLHQGHTPGQFRQLHS